MDWYGSRRLTALAAFLTCFLLTTWLESVFSDTLNSLPLSRTKRSTVTQMDGADVQTLLNQDQPQGIEKVRVQILKNRSPQDTAEPSGPKNIKRRRSKGEVLRLSPPEDAVILDSHDGIIDMADYQDELMTSLQERVAQIRRKVYKCLPKFICEVHSQTLDTITTDLEKEWINMYSPSMLSETQHEYQVAAHMGQLFKGYQPSPCHQLYTGCPISMAQIKTFLAAVDNKRNRLL
ncbi:uncharacterized protein LOC108664968 [Hyalella azteca]|uniref:Uncharacterized protein LOC108664968 n=1 Tax=Hyalella azteca TaxID=294128 RepID=A0A8B7N1Q9_HYAAZ|nr:uncharacterized protein LOC108664968 [Hyalella azteca]XP_018007159.1 uncharacterized protein LOC108664968 [Hyalella azteca]XP_047739722.1 uncharacterized protein LOC108664968 [Hyalella azteca]XP_047739723.1 uncharacterized protein LOC108664968 [Hyalella azteca]XP_047739724.1 uncharacterized protein LOC108664968 [Hyalella azteca]